MKKILLVAGVLMLSQALRAQSPGLKLVVPNSSLLKVDLKKNKAPDGLEPASFFPREKKKGWSTSLLRQPNGVSIVNQDRMPCLTVDPKKIDPKSIVWIRQAPYMPNPYK